VKTNGSHDKALNILAVDDEEGARASLKLVLKLAGHHAFVASDAVEALKIFQNTPEPFDLIIADHAMRGSSGVDLVRKLREKGYKGEIVILSANVNLEAETEYRKLGVAGLMEKPFNIKDLKEWTLCIQECRERLANGEKPPCTPMSKNFCWLNRE